jgi:hypothetical protein
MQKIGGTMKKQIAVVSSLAFIAAFSAFAQPDSDQNSGQAQGIIILEPSGAEPPAPQAQDPNAPAQDPNAAFPPNASGAAAAENVTTVTVSQTFTNQPNSVTILGHVNSEQEKQAAEAKLQEALPGKQINNHLSVSGQGVNEPAGAEKEKDKKPAEEQEQNDNPSPDEAGAQGASSQ